MAGTYGSVSSRESLVKNRSRSSSQISRGRC